LHHINYKKAGRKLRESILDLPKVRCQMMSPSQHYLDVELHEYGQLTLIFLIDRLDLLVQEKGAVNGVVERLSGVATGMGVRLEKLGCKTAVRTFD
jgi:hypothetical protein